MVREEASVASLRPWAGRLRRADGRKRALFQLDDPKIAERVKALPALDVVLALKELGVNDSVSALALLSEEQTRALFDLEMWEGDHLASEEAILWLQGFQEAGPEALLSAAGSLDREALILLLRRRLRIGLKPKDDASDPIAAEGWMSSPPPELEPLVETPDGVYIIAARAVEEGEEEEAEPLDEEARKWILGFVEALYRREDWQDTTGLLRAAMDDLSSSLEEDAYRFSTGRKEDLGFPPLSRAIEVYAPLDPATLSAPKLPPSPALDRPLPALYAHSLSEGLLLSVLDSIDDPKLAERIEAELLAVGNKLLVADGVRVGQREATEAALAGMRGYIELAMAFDPEGGAADPASRIALGLARLKERHLSELVRIGYTLSLRAKARARTLQGRSLSSLDASVLEALSFRRPRFCPALDPWVQTGSAALDPAGLGLSRAFSAPEELAAVHAWIDELEALVAFVDARGLQASPAEALPAAPERTLDVLAATALARRMLGQAAEARALDGAELSDLADGIALKDGQPRFAPARVEAALSELPELLLPRAERWLCHLAEQLYPQVGSERVDARFVEGLLRRI